MASVPETVTLGRRDQKTVRRLKGALVPIVDCAQRDGVEVFRQRGGCVLRMWQVFREGSSLGVLERGSRRRGRRKGSSWRLKFGAGWSDRSTFGVTADPMTCRGQ